MSPLDSNNPGVVVQKPKSDVYTTMLFLAFIAIIIACLCLWLEMRAYNMDIKANEARVSVTSLQWTLPGPHHAESMAAVPALDTRL